MDRQLRVQMATTDLVDDVTAMVAENEDHPEWFKMRGLVKKAQGSLKAGDLHSTLHSCFLVGAILEPEDGDNVWLDEDAWLDGGAK